LQRIPFKNLASVGGCLKSINQHRRRRFPLFLPTNYSEEPKKLIEQLLLLDYNCVTNSGRCFLDSKDKELLEELVYHLRLRYIETLEKQKS